MANPRGFPQEVEAFQAWLKANAPSLSESLEQVLDAEVQHNKHSHILYTLIMCAFDAGRDYERQNPGIVLPTE